MYLAIFYISVVPSSYLSIQISTHPEYTSAIKLMYIDIKTNDIVKLIDKILKIIRTIKGVAKKDINSFFSSSGVSLF